MSAQDPADNELVVDTLSDVELTWSPDGRWLAFSGVFSRDWHIYRIRPDGTDLYLVTDTKRREVDPAWNPGWVNDIDEP